MEDEMETSSTLRESLNPSGRSLYARSLSLALASLAALIFAAACSAPGEGIFTIKERNDFTELGNQFISTTNSILKSINEGATKGDFAGVKAATDPQFAALDSTISQMQSQAANLKGEPQSLANQMAATATQWSTQAKAAVTAGTAGDEAAYKAAITQANALADSFNNLITQWNQIQAK